MIANRFKSIRMLLEERDAINKEIRLRAYAILRLRGYERGYEISSDVAINVNLTEMPEIAGAMITITCPLFPTITVCTIEYFDTQAPPSENTNID